VGTISAGAERKCFVLGANGQPEMRDIVVGLSNERLVEVRSGLAEGEQVVLNPQPLLKDGSEMKAGRPRIKAQEEGERPGGAPGAGAGGPGAGGKNWKGMKGPKGGKKGPPKKGPAAQDKGFRGSPPGGP
jgi:hypothetical protein